MDEEAILAPDADVESVLRIPLGAGMTLRKGRGGSWAQTLKEAEDWAKRNLLPRHQHASAPVD